MFQATQCVKSPTGASGSWTISASDCVPAGGALQSSGGETLSPSQEYLRGIGCPSLNAMLVSSNSGILRSFLFAHAVSQTDWGLDAPLGCEQWPERSETQRR